MEATMRIALVHDHYDEEHLEQVVSEMRELGAPRVHAVWMECYNAYQALEGCHRIRAAHALGFVPEIVDVEYSDAMASSVLGYDGDSDYMISEICDDLPQNPMMEF
jgi:hypothetical protein